MLFRSQQAISGGGVAHVRQGDARAQKKSAGTQAGTRKEICAHGCEPSFYCFLPNCCFSDLHPVIGATTERGVSRGRELPLDGRHSELVSVLGA